MTYPGVLGPPTLHFFCIEGSAWPAFGLRVHALTDYRASDLVFVPDLA